MSTYSLVLFLFLYFDLLQLLKKHCENINIKSHVCIFSATTDVLWCSCFAELNKNRRKLFEPPIRSSFLEGGASGRLSRQFHADMASISGRWQSPTRQPRTVHFGDLPPVYFCVSAIQVSVVVYPLFSFRWIKTVMLSLP